EDLNPGAPLLLHGVYSWHSGKVVDEGNICCNTRESKSHDRMISTVTNKVMTQLLRTIFKNNVIIFKIYRYHKLIH
ncbi:hypothetical protein ACTQLO_08805, partial [Streptococcus pyogenes]